MGIQSPLSPHFCLPLLNPVFYYENYQVVGNSKTKLENGDKQIIPCHTKDTSHFSLYYRNMSHFKLTDSKKMINLQNKNDIKYFGSKFFCERYDNILILCYVWNQEENI